MNLSLKTFSQLIEDMSAALQSSASNLVDVSVGSVARALFEANASVVLWLQWLLLQVLQTTRASTSTGSDLDSWMADFNLSRLPSRASTGMVTLSRYSSNITAAIPIGTIVKTSDGSLSFSITIDPSISIWQPILKAYVIPVGVASANLPVICTLPGQAGNILSGTITVIASSLPGVDQVTNANAFANGIDEEADQPFRNRFSVYLAGLSRATLNAVQSAVANVQQGLQVCIQENTAADGSSHPGSFLVVVDDGSGFPPSTLLTNITNAVDLVRPIGTMFSVQPPQVLTVSVAFAVFLGPSIAANQTILTNIQQNVANYLNGLPIGQVASATRIAQCAYSTSNEILNVSNVLLNELSADVVPLATTVLKAGQIVVTPNGG